MARLIKTSENSKFSRLNVDSIAFGERNDCYVMAIALLTGESYATVHAAMKANGRRNYDGTWHCIAKRACFDLGFHLIEQPLSVIIDIINQYPGAHKQLKSITTHHPRRFKKVWANQPNMLFNVRSHVAAFVDGELLDWTVNSSRRVTSLCTVEKI